MSCSQCKIIDGKKIAEDLRAELKIRAEKFFLENGRRIGLAVILAGDDPASKIYVGNKEKACKEVGIDSYVYRLEASASETEIISLIEKLNADGKVDGLLVQLPLPDKSAERRVLSHVSPRKDVDGFHAENVGALLLGEDALKACTPSGIMKLIDSTGIEIAGKHAVVVGRSNIVGKPVAMMLLQRDATVTVCHSRTANLKEITLSADILVVAVGKREFISGDMIKKGGVVIDVGMNRDGGKLYGDVNFSEAIERAAFLTPVPGGVGPLTIAMLLDNTVKAASRGR